MHRVSGHCSLPALPWYAVFAVSFSFWAVGMALQGIADALIILVAVSGKLPPGPMSQQCFVCVAAAAAAAAANVELWTDDAVLWLPCIALQTALGMIMV
jgi:hypothetical protein